MDFYGSLLIFQKIHNSVFVDFQQLYNSVIVFSPLKWSFCGKKLSKMPEISEKCRFFSLFIYKPMLKSFDYQQFGMLEIFLFQQFLTAIFVISFFYIFVFSKKRKPLNLKIQRLFSSLSTYIIPSKLQLQARHRQA